MGRAGEDLVELGIVGGRDGAGDVVGTFGVHGTGPIGQRAVVADDGVERIDLDLHEVTRILGDVARLGDDERHGLAGEPDVAVGEDPERPPAVAALEVDPRFLDVAVEVGAGEHGDHAGQLPGGGDVEGRDRPAGDVAAHERHVEHAWHDDVVDVRAVPGDQPGILAPLHALPDEAVAARRPVGGGGAGSTIGGGRHDALRAPAAICTALTIPWYPVHRQRLPDRPSRIAASSGSALRASRAVIVTTKPGVQKPHCSP